MIIFERTERRTTKMNITIFLGWGKWVPNIVIKFFSSENFIPSDLNPKTGFGGTFSPIPVVLLGQLFPKTIGFTHEGTHTSHVNFMKIDSKLRPVS